MAPSRPGRRAAPVTTTAPERGAGPHPAKAGPTRRPARLRCGSAASRGRHAGRPAAGRDRAGRGAAPAGGRQDRPSAPTGPTVASGRTARPVPGSGGSARPARRPAPGGTGTPRPGGSVRTVVAPAAVPRSPGSVDRPGRRRPQRLARDRPPPPPRPPDAPAIPGHGRWSPGPSRRQAPDPSGDRPGAAPDRWSIVPQRGGARAGGTATSSRPGARAGGPVRPRHGASGRRDARPSGPPPVDPRTVAWGGVARRGSRALREPRPGSAQEAWRQAATPGDRDRGVPGPHTPDEWIDGGPVREEAERAVGRGVGTRPVGRPARRCRCRATSPRTSSGRAGRARPGGSRTSSRRRPPPTTGSATGTPAGSWPRWSSGRRRLAAGRELYGLTLYRMGRWREAIRELEAFGEVSASVDQLPVVADSHRALGHHREVDRLWDELRRGAPGSRS